ncbi:hypothetical protein RSOLAG22IIIB_02207 [Rhizoctonia solani]|uniref:Methyltransferase type 11 domain-containing protein n=1 Tax=Rhizoctonia solani TaxID=456999 RepID=A0A0K6GDP9_9AGAM|nr:hypothetical protein RSOLAG22IIIB_02207 [Rhizoctonia solani]
MDELELGDNPVYFVDDCQDDDSDMDSVHTGVSELTVHTMSTLTSDAVTEYFQEINGRMFPIDENIPTLFPTDHAEVRRLELQHLELKVLLKGNYFGPVKEVLAENASGRRKRVLDLITADGTWVREMAAEFPHVDFTSVDTVPLVPHTRVVNILSYEVYDLYNGIAEHDETFDVVHLRHAMSRIRDIPALLMEIHRVLRPGGLFLYGEYQNNGFDASTPDHSAADTAPNLIRALRITRDIYMRQGAYAYAFRDVPPLLDPSCPIWAKEKKKGFTGIRGEEKIVPAGGWHPVPRMRELGLITQQVWCELWRGMRPTFLSDGGMNAEEVDNIIDSAIDELVNPGPRLLYGKYHVLYAFKPI